jgi:hypothetical protein
VALHRRSRALWDHTIIATPASHTDRDLVETLEMKVSALEELPARMTAIEGTLIAIRDRDADALRERQVREPADA